MLQTIPDRQSWCTDVKQTREEVTSRWQTDTSRKVTAKSTNRARSQKKIKKQQIWMHKTCKWAQICRLNTQTELVQKIDWHTLRWSVCTRQYRETETVSSTVLTRQKVGHQNTMGTCKDLPQKWRESGEWALQERAVLIMALFKAFQQRKGEIWVEFTIIPAN